MMLRLGRSIRLTKVEIERLTFITGFKPDNVKTLDQFERYLTHCFVYYRGTSDEALFLNWLIQREKLRYLA